MHPRDAERRDVSTDDVIRVFNGRGEVHCLALVDSDMKPGVVCLPKGLWRRSTLNGSTANALAPDDLTDLGDGACFNDARVEVTRIVAAELGGGSVAIWTDTSAAKGLH